MPGGRRTRPRGRPYTFACRVCKIVLRDGVDYTWCPRCNNEVDWIDGRYRVLTCDDCDLLVNKRLVDNDACPNCDARLTAISGPLGTDDQPSAKRPMWVATKRAGLAVVIVQAVLAALDPDAYPYLSWMLALLYLGTFCVIGWLLANSGELRDLSTYHATRVIHGLEHATANVLEERGVHVIEGLTGHGMFTLVVEHDGTHYEHFETTVRDAAKDAISRIRFGETSLAYTQRCGTSQLVGYALLSIAVVGAGLAALILDVPSGLTFAFTVAAGFVANALTPRAGIAAQRWLTVSTSFASATVTHVEKRVSSDGNQLAAVVMIDVIPKQRVSAITDDAVSPIPM